MRIMQCLNCSAGYSTDLIELWNIHQLERSQKRELLGLGLEAQGIILCLFELSNRRPVIKKKPAFEQAFYIWSGREDSNLRHLAPHASALPG